MSVKYNDCNLTLAETDREKFNQAYKKNLGVVPKRIGIIFDYPFSKQFYQVFTSSKPIGKADLLYNITKMYQHYFKQYQKYVLFKDLNCLRLLEVIPVNKDNDIEIFKLKIEASFPSDSYWVGDDWKETSPNVEYRTKKQMLLMYSMRLMLKNVDSFRNSNGHHCEECDRYVLNYQQHIRLKNHGRPFKITNSENYCNVCQFETDNLEKHNTRYVHYNSLLEKGLIQ